MSDVKTLKLKNGISLILAPKKETKIIDVVISFRVGGRYEDQKKSGISHFYEHMMFDGTKNRPTANAIAKEVDAMGARFNASTWDEYTTYYISASDNYLSKAIEILGDMLSNSLLLEKDVKKEKNVIVEEIKMNQDMPAEQVIELFDKTIFNGDPLSGNISGDYKTVNSISKKDLENFRDKFYVAENCYVGIGGNFVKFSEEEIIRLIEKNLILKNGQPTEIFPAKVSSIKENYSTKDTAQTNLIAGFIGPAYNSEEYYSFSVLATILGGNMSSRMFSKIREELELAYDVRTDINCTTTIGSISTQAGVPNEKFADALAAISGEYQRIKKDLSPEEVENAKTYQIGHSKLSFENSYNTAYFILKYYFTTGKLTTVEEIIDKINSVTFNDVKKVAEKYLIADRMTVTAIGPKVK
ncbi:MAG: pitrilysin family protein [Candidatus Berkelbacteria bacterium]|nr:pitrilysin family protein [Candidatus Berkelbacteria bacterium]